MVRLGEVFKPEGLGQTVLPLVENAPIENFKWDISVILKHCVILCSKSNRNFLWREILDYRVLRSLLIFCFGHPTFQLISAMEHFFAVAGNVSRICRLCISPLEVLGGEPKKGALNFHELLAIKSCYRKEVWTPTTRVRHNRAGALRRRSESARPGWLYKP